jgi:4-hydroxybenzoate polyprenyltransferase
MPAADRRVRRHAPGPHGRVDRLVLGWLSIAVFAVALYLIYH